MIRSHKIRLTPNNVQASLLAQHCGFARFAYNHALADFKSGLDEGEWRGDRTLRPRWNAEKDTLAPWCRTLSQYAAKNAIINLGRAIQAFGANRARFPSFKKKGRHDSYTASNDPDTVPVNGRLVQLPKIGPVRMREELRFVGSVKTVTVSKTAGRWYASFAVDDGTEPAPVRTGESVGIDMGVVTLATLSDGTTVENPRPLASALRRLRHLDKVIARSRKLNGSKSSNRRRRLMDRRARLHERIRALRNDVHHKATTAIVKWYAGVRVETLNVAGMMRNRQLARALADAGVSSFLRMLEYKSELYGAVFTKADQWFASAKTCHA